MQIQLQDDAVMHEAVDGRGGRHRIFEDPLPFGERQVACQHHAAALAFGWGEPDGLACSFNEVLGLLVGVASSLRPARPLRVGSGYV